MRTLNFLWVVLGFWSLWLVSSVVRHGILHKERKTIEETMIKTQALMHTMQLTLIHADEVVKGLQKDYEIKSSHLPATIHSIDSLFITLRYASIVVVILVVLGMGKYLFKS